MLQNMDIKVLRKRLIGVLAGVLFMGFGISWLVPCNFGTDGFTALNLAIADKLGWTFGNWQAAENVVMFIIVLWLDRKLIGIGTLANMILVGYFCDFCSWIWGMLLPANFFEPMWIRIVVAIPALLIFVLGAALYMDMELGTSPYDALPFIIHKRLGKFSFRAVRMTYDLTVIVLGYFSGVPFAIATLMMAFLLGPSVEYVGKKIKPFFEGK